LVPATLFNPHFHFERLLITPWEPRTSLFMRV
jgi:hypothetical protein